MAKRRAPVAPGAAAIERCGFCGKPRAEVRLLVTSSDRVPAAFICDVCVLLAVHALADKLGGDR